MKKNVSQLIKVSSLFFVLVMVCSTLHAQISVSSSGVVTLAGDLTIGPYYTSCQILPGEKNAALLGSYNKQFYTIYGYAFYGNGTYIGSDKRIKENFRSIGSPLSKILQMEGWEYDLISDSSDTVGTEEVKKEKAEMKKDRLGFVAQEMEEVLPEAVRYDEINDQYYLEYTAIIPVIVEAMKEQQATIDKLTERIETLEGNNSSNEKSATIDETTLASLDQNIPNPFSDNTSIEMYLPNTVTKAILYIYNMQGEQIKQIVVNEKGNTSVTIEGHTLKAGMFLYTLIADGNEVDTKRMILTE